MASYKKKTKQSAKKPKPVIVGDFMDWRYHPTEPICNVPPTNPNKKPDLFNEYKPKKEDNLDYVISQTFCKMDAGCTRINLQQTRAEYEPAKEKPPEPKKRRKVAYGRGPIWEYLEEKIARKIEEMQARYRKEFAEYQRRKKKERRLEGEANEEAMLKRVGPDWYQELSPKQLNVVDNLKSCIIKDLQLESVVYTKENIAELGLVLRPNTKHLEIALKFCCCCPVEFLLILYQVINPKRTEYSLNDRLLLSAVVHLTMTSTLKELHIRIPSPPKFKPNKPNEVNIEKHKEKRKHYDSPYLVPFTFVPEPRKYSGVYMNKHVQKPESPYFSYLTELKCQPKFDLDKFAMEALTSSDHSWDIVLDILQECCLAQTIYNKLADNNVAPSLYMPNIYPECIRIPEEVEEEESVVSEEQPIVIIDETKQLRYLQAIDKLQEQLINLSQKFVIGGVSIGQDGVPVYILVAVLSYRECPCAKALRQIEKEREKQKYNKLVQDLQYELIESDIKYIIGGLTITADGKPVYIINSTTMNRGVCLKHRKAIRDKERVDKYKEKLSTQCEKYVIGGVCKGRNGHTVFHISSARPLKACTCDKHTEIVKEMMDKRTPLEKSQDHLKQFKQKFVIGGVIVKNGFPVYIISTVYETKDCTCGNHVLVYGKIRDKRDVMEMLQYKLIISSTTYVIGGVTYDPDGLPVFTINAVMLRKELCERHQKIKDGYKELCPKHKKMEELHSNIKSHRTKFVVGGVTYDRRGKSVFILSQVVPYKGLCPRHIKPKLLLMKALQQQKNIKELKQKFALGGVVYVGYEKEPVYLIQSVVIYRKLCWKHRIKGIENDAIDEMQERFRKFRQQFVIGGVTGDRIGRPVYILNATITLRYACAHRKSLGPLVPHEEDIDLKELNHDEIKEDNDTDDEILITSTHSFCNTLTCKGELKGIGDKDYIKTVAKMQDRLIYSSIKYILNGITSGKDGEPVYIINGVRKQRECMCQTTFPSSSEYSTSEEEEEEEEDMINKELVDKMHRDIKSYSQRFIITGVTYDEDKSPIFTIAGVAANTCVCVRKIPQPPKEKDVYPLYYRLESERIRQTFSESINKYVNGGIALAPNGQPVFIIQSAIPIRECPCIRAIRQKREAALAKQQEDEEHQAHVKLNILAEEQKLLQTKPLPDDECVCKEECEKFIKRTMSNRCQCAQCQEDLEQAKKIFIIDGVEVQKGEPIRVVQGITDLKECDCLERYRKKVERYEDLKARHEVKATIKSLPKKYAISGVTIGPDKKPIYILSGLAPEKKCTCADEAYEEQQRLLKAPKPFPCCGPRFIISGIRYEMDGTVYIVTGVVPIPDCRCMDIYHAFLDRHTPCMELYEKYMEKVEKDMKRYMRDLEEDEKYWDNMSVDEKCVCEEQELCLDECESKSPPKIPVSCPKPPFGECCQRYVPPPCPPTCAAPPPSVKTKNKKTKRKGKICKCKEEIQPDKECTCTEDEQCVALCQIKETFSDIMEEETEDEEHSVTPTDNKEKSIELKRYIILSKIPCDPIAQICVLQEALQTLAEDGFPLAKLPDCYMLPHFKLWMDMRCGKYWTQANKKTMVLRSRADYSHAIRFVKRCSQPTLPISTKKATKTTFSKANLYKQMVEEAKEKYIRQNKQDRVADVRKLFPATRDYEFPTKTFRHCYFAYLPSKEEDCFMFRKYTPGDVKDMRRAKRCV